MWVEILSRNHHDVTHRHRCSGDEIRIGRGYDNDIVLDDPTVAPHHLRLQRDPDGGWMAEDLGTANGLHTEHGKGRIDRIALDGDQVIRIGRTLLRARPATYPVAPEYVATRGLPLWPFAVACAAGIIGIELASAWLAETGETRPLAYLGAVLQVIAVAIGWVGVWTILCRVFTGYAQFERHLLIALIGLFGYSLFDEVLKLAGFALSWPRVLGFEYFVMWSVVAVLCAAHLRVILPRRQRLSGGIVAALAGLAVITQTLTEREMHRNADPSPVQGRLYPPMLRLVPPQSDAQFFGDVARLQDKLQAKRVDEDR